MAALTTGREVKHAASSAELITETDSLSAIKLWATNRGGGEFSLHEAAGDLSVWLRMQECK